MPVPLPDAAAVHSSPSPSSTQHLQNQLLSFSVQTFTVGGKCVKLSVIFTGMFFKCFIVQRDRTEIKYVYEWCVCVCLCLCTHIL